MNAAAAPEERKGREAPPLIDRLYKAESRGDISTHQEVQDSLNDLRSLQAKKMIADGEKAKALSEKIKADTVHAADDLVIEEARDTMPPVPMSKEGADDAYYAKMALRLEPSDLKAYKALYSEYEGVKDNLEGAGMLEKRKLNARAASLEKELAPYWDKIQRFDEFKVLKEGGAGMQGELDQEVIGQLLPGNKELVNRAIAANVPGLTSSEDLDAFGANLLEEQHLEGVINSAKGFMGFFKRASAENKLKKLRSQLVPLKEAVMSSKGTSGSNLDARRMGRAAQ